MQHKSHYVAIAVLAALLGGTAVAHQGASGIVKQRMDAMSEIGRASKSLAGMAKGKAPVDVRQVRELGALIARHADHITTLFPDTRASRHGAQTEARPEIWSEWRKFERLSHTLRDHARALAVLPTDNAGNALERLQRNLAASCRACHKRFRSKKAR